METKDATEEKEIKRGNGVEGKNQTRKVINMIYFETNIVNVCFFKLHYNGIDGFQSEG